MKKGNDLRFLAYTNPITWFFGVGFVIGVVVYDVQRAFEKAVTEFEKELEE
jgi:hypothetical protein